MIDWLVLGGCLALLLAVSAGEGLVADRAVAKARDRALAGERREGEGTPPDELGPVELGMLAGGRIGAVDVLLAGLIADGVLRRVGPDGERPETEGPETEGPDTKGPDTEGQNTEGQNTEGPERWVAVNPSPATEPGPLEQAVRTAAAAPGLYLWELTALCLAPAVSAVEESLVAQGCLRPAHPAHSPSDSDSEPPYPVPEIPARRWVLAAAGAVALLCAAVLARDGAWLRAALAVLAAGVTVATSWRAPAELAYRTRPLPRVTWRGAHCLERARTRYAELDPRSRPTSTPYEPGESRTAVALFGWAALTRLHPGLLTDRTAPLVHADGPGA